MDASFEGELEARLAQSEAEATDDPARRDLPRIDVIALVVGCLVLIALMWWWGSPA
jgi:ferric-dicitrate binding protein FerR (iron transport regulator)